MLNFNHMDKNFSQLRTHLHHILVRFEQENWFSPQKKKAKIEKDEEAKEEEVITEEEEILRMEARVQGALDGKVLPVFFIHLSYLKLKLD